MYDAVGNVSATVDPLGNRTTFVYDALYRPTKQIDALVGMTTLGYDAVNNLTSVIDPLGNRTTFVYDALDRRTESIDPLGASATFAYNAVNQLASTTDRTGRRRDFAYDALHRLTTDSWYATGGSLAETHTFSYDANGNLLAAVDPDGTNTFTYDALDRTASSRGPFGTALTFVYDAAGNRTGVQDNFGGVETSTYNAVNLLTSRQYTGQGASLRFDLAYTVRDQVESVRRYSDLAGTNQVGATSMAYDTSGRLTNQKHQDGGTTWFHNATYTYDLADRVSTETLNGTTKTFSYDALNQVTNDGANAYSFDANGNRTMSGYTTGTGNQVTNDGTWTYTYDSNGNRNKKSKGASQETWTYGYDHQNRLLWAEQRATDGGTLLARVDYKYDALGNRIERAADTDGNGSADVIERFAYDGGDVFADLNSSNSLTTRRIFGDDYLAAPAACISSAGAVAWYQTDRLGSVVALTDGAGVLKDTIQYDGFGKITSESDASFGDRYKFTGRERDSVTGLQLHDWRQFDPATGTWTSRDPIGFAAGDANLYRYVRNNAPNGVDPSGLDDGPQIVQVQIAAQFTKEEWEEYRALMKEFQGITKEELQELILAQLEQDLLDKLNESLPEGEKICSIDQIDANAMAKNAKPEAIILVMIREAKKKSTSEALSLLTQMRKAHIRVVLETGFLGRGMRFIDAWELKFDSQGPYIELATVQWFGRLGWSNLALGVARGDRTIGSAAEQLREGIVASQGDGKIKDFLVGLGDLMTKHIQAGLTLPELSPEKEGFQEWRDEWEASIGYGLAYTGEAIKQRARDEAISAAGGAILSRLRGLAKLRRAKKATVGKKLDVPESKPAGSGRASPDPSNCPSSPAGRVPLQVKPNQVCFAAGTHVLTPGGSKPIEEFQVGESVVSRNDCEPDGVVEHKGIEEVFTRIGRILRLKVSGKTIETTPEHPFFVRGQGWRCARELHRMDVLGSHNGAFGIVEEIFETGEIKTVYNLRVADFHTYFVGESHWEFSVWAHNAMYEVVEGRGGIFHIKDRATGKIVEFEGIGGEIPFGTREQAEQWILRNTPVAHPGPSAFSRELVQEAKRAFDSNDDFRRWWHKKYASQEKIGGGPIRNPDLPPADIAEGYQEWLNQGRPKPP